MSCPSNMTFPVSCVVKPPRIRRVVVLPQPLGPSRVTKLFSRMERFKSSSTNSPSKLLDICCKSINGWLMMNSFSFYRNSNQKLGGELTHSSSAPFLLVR